MTSFTAGLRPDGLIAPLVLDGPWMTLSWPMSKHCSPHRCSRPTYLTLPAHEVHGVREAIQAVGARLLYLPPNSPDFNPIEMAFSKLKALLRAPAACTMPDLWQAIASARKASHPISVKIISPPLDTTQPDRKAL
jgi:hypothetical protein